MAAEQRRYLAYLLRLWEATPSGGPPVWRASLENPHTGQRLHFASLEHLVAYLDEAAHGGPPSAADEVPSGKERP